MRVAIYGCIGGIFFLGLIPGPVLKLTNAASEVLNLMPA